MAEPTGVETPADDAAYFTEEYAEEPFDAEAGPFGVHDRVLRRGRAARARAVRLSPATPTVLGRRKEAVARVRIVPGTGEWKINGRSLDSYFPNKVHQQIVGEPFVTLGAEGNFDVIARIVGGGVSGQAGALRLGVARALILVDPENRSAAEEGGLPHPGRPGDGAEEVRSQEGPQGAPVLQALVVAGT